MIFTDKTPPQKGYMREYTLFEGKNGTYEVSLTLEGSGVFSLFYTSRRFIFINTPINGKKEISFTASLCDRKFFNCEYEPVTKLTVGIMGDAVITSASVTPCTAATVYIAGDSTVTDQAAEYPYNPHSTYCGWGQMLPAYLGDGIAVSNHAQSGNTSQNHLDNQHTVLEKRVKPGDFLFVQFGHNDQKHTELDAFGGYASNLHRLVRFAKERGAHPVLCTPINRIIFEPDGSLRPLLDNYAKAVRAVAAEENIPYIDLHQRTTEFFTKLGEPDSWAYFWSDGVSSDYTHTNDIGGELVARFVAQGIYEQNISGLSEYILRDRLTMPTPIHGYKSSAKPQNPVDSIGLVNVPADLDRDI